MNACEFPDCGCRQRMAGGKLKIDCLWQAANPVRCFACDRAIKTSPRVVTCLDEQTVHVGPCCFAKAESAGLDGYQPPKGGPRLYTIEAKAELLAACDCQHPETTKGGFAAKSETCPIHGGEFIAVTTVF